jgi:hypothetical protein
MKRALAVMPLPPMTVRRSVLVAVLFVGCGPTASMTQADVARVTMQRVDGAWQVRGIEVQLPVPRG